MYELQSDDNSVMNYWETICKDRWAFIVDYTRKADKIRVLANDSDFKEYVQYGLKHLIPKNYDRFIKVSVKIIQESEWLSIEKVVKE
jgi:hypothetical protein